MRLLAITGLLVATVSVAAVGKGHAVPNDDAAIAHALNRLAFGPRRGDVDRVRAIGLDRWIDQQLQPGRIANGALEGRLTRLDTLTLDSASIARDYFLPARQARRERQRAATADSVGGTPAASGSEPSMSASASDATRQINDVVRQERRIFADLAEAKLLRAVYSERQLEEVLVDFWFNHFNVFARKGRTEIYVGEYERDAIRRHVLGTFRELLGATAHSPAMLFYLDNWQSVAPNARTRRLQVRASQPEQGEQPQPQRTRGLNENYARELLELHTLGVDGGYTQDDIVHVARAFTGWTIGRPAEGGFRFAANLHDREVKVVLGETIKAGGGIEDGERVLDILAKHPSTAKHIAFKLAQRFVSDTPPASLVDRAARTFETSDGNLRAVVRTIITSPEFFDPAARLNKLKTPFEFVASALRAANADVRDGMAAVRALAGMGMPLYLCQPPTGWDETSDTWVSSGALVSRINFAVALGRGQVRGANVAAPQAGANSVQLGSAEFQKQ